MNRFGARKNRLRQKVVARPPKEGFRSFCGEQNRDEIPAGDGNAAERKRSRSEADTGRRIGASLGSSSCGSLSRAVRRHPTRRTATRRGSLHSPLAANCYRLRANSTIPRGIVVLGRGVRARGRMGRAFAVLRTAGPARWAVRPTPGAHSPKPTEWGVKQGTAFATL